MLITKQFHDYYDGVAAQGIDKTIVYRRIPYTLYRGNATNYSWVSDKQPDHIENAAQIMSSVYEKIRPHLLTVDSKQRAFSRWRSASVISEALDNLGYYGLNAFVVLAHGKVFVGYRIHQTISESKYVYGAKNIADELNIVDKIRYRNNDTWHTVKLEPVSFFEKIEEDIKHLFASMDVDEIHRSLSTPIISFDRSDNCVKLNPCLKDVNFASCEDPYTIFQELQMYHSTITGITEPDMIQVSDTVKRDSHGFDNYSFKKRPGA